jgi:cell division protein FtsI (penicillin-binding protein 3)
LRRVRPALRRGNPSRRLNAGLLAIMFVLSLFAGRLVQMQGLDWASYRQEANSVKEVRAALPTVRGAIYASNGTILAMTVQTYLVYADPTMIPAARRPAVAAALAGPLGMPAAAILSLMDHPTSPAYVVLRRGVSQAAVSQIRARMTAMSEYGIAETASYSRVYPNGDLAANLVGFTDLTAAGDLRGEAGVEQEYNALLAGRDGSEEFEQGTDGQPIPGTTDILRPQVPAESLRLTIQSDIQWYAEQACAAEARKVRAKTCTAVVMVPKTGKILAMAQYPLYNPAAPQSLAATTDLPISELFAPGSTGKVVTVAAALERGGQTPMSVYTVPDQIVVDGFPFHDAEYHPTGRYTIAGILARSSNVGMVQVVQHVSPQVQYDYLKAFGLNEPTGLGLPGESPGLLPPVSKWWGDERYTLSFGQGIAVNAVQMASVYATIANGGVRVQPSIVAGTISSSGRFTPARPAPRRRVIREKTARELIRILQQVPWVDNAAGEPWGIIPGYSIAAKTGTSQEPDPQRGNCLCEYGSSYIGMAPASDPKIVVAINVQDPRSGTYYGDAVAGPVFYHIMKFALATEKIPPDGGGRPRVRLSVP